LVRFDGGEVERYFREGKIKEIADYCETVVGTYQVWLRYELFRSTLSQNAFEASQRNLADFTNAALERQQCPLRSESDRSAACRKASLCASSGSYEFTDFALSISALRKWSSGPPGRESSQPILAHGSASSVYISPKTSN